MPAERVAPPSFLDNLRASDLLTGAQLDELRKCPEAKDPSPTPLARVVHQRGWLTRFQINMVAAGRGPELTVGPYLLLDRLGEGGMGMVYKARHQHMQRVVALKVIRKEKLASPEAVRRFYSEVQLAAALSHPNIVLAYDAGPAGSTHYFAMEYVEGTDLARLVKEQGRLPVERACEYVRQAALGLQHAHEKGLVHRDVKPANLMLSLVPGPSSLAENQGPGTRDQGPGTVKLLDMGLARLQGAGDTGMTRLGAVIGTPDYLAPEQAMNSKAADIRADLYSLGCTLYYLLTGGPPFAAGELTEVLLKHQMDKPAPLAERGVEAPEGLQTILDRLMAKDPADRYQTPAELAADLAPFCGAGIVAANVIASRRDAGPAEENAWASLTEEGDREKVAAGRSKSAGRTVELPRHGSKKTGDDDEEAEARKKRVLLLASAGAGVGLLLVVGLFGAVVWWKSGPAPDPRLAVAPPATQPEPKGPDTPAEGSKPAPPPTGDKPAPPSNDGGKPVPPPVFGNPPIQPAHNGYRVKENLPAFEFALGADGGALALVEDPRRLRVEVNGGKLSYRYNFPAATIDCFALTPDGLQLLVAESDRAIHVWRIGDEKERLFLRGHTEPVKCLAVSADGRLAISGGGKPGVDTTVRVWDLTDGKELARLQGHDGAVERVAFAPDGKRAVSVGGDGDVRVWDVPAAKELFRLDALKPAGPTCAAFSPDGNRLLVGDRGGNLNLVDAATGRPVRRFTRIDGTVVWDVTFTPDGERAVVARALAPGADRAEVEVWGVERGDRYHEIKFHTESVRRVIVADGGRLAYSSGEDGLLCRADVLPLPDGYRGGEAAPVASSGVVILPPNMGQVTALAFSPDGKRAALAGAQVRLWDVEHNKELHDFGGAKFNGVSCLAWSADGRRLLAGGLNGQLVLLDADKRTQVMTFSGHDTQVHAVALSPDGRHALSAAGEFVRKDNDIVKGPDGKPVFRDTDLRLWDVATGKEVGRFPGPAEGATAVAFSADGKHVYAVGQPFAGFVTYEWSVDKPEAPRKLLVPAAHLGWAVSPDTREVAVLGGDQVLRVCELETGKELRHSEKLDNATRLKWSRDGRTIACGGGLHSKPGGVKEIGPVRLLDAATCKEVKRFAGHTTTTMAIDVSPDGRYVLGTTSNGGVRLWDRDPGAPPDKPVADVPAPDKPAPAPEKPRFVGHDGSVLAVAFSPDGKKLLSAGKDQTVRVWDVATGQEVKKVGKSFGAPHRVAFAAKGKEAVVTSLGEGYTSWDIETGKVLINLGFGQHRTDAISADGELILLPRTRNRVEFYRCDDASGAPRALSGTWDTTVAAAFVPESQVVVFVGGDGLLHVADLKADKEVGKGLSGLKGDVICLAVSPKATHLLTATEDKAVTLWKLPTLPATTLPTGHALKGHKDKVTCLAFAPDGKHVVTGGDDATVRVWDLQGKQVALSEEHKEAVRGVAFSPDGKAVVSCGDGIKVWEWQPKPPAKP
jgi:WD40 repeat protein/serine/threonine protein kinase